MQSYCILQLSRGRRTGDTSFHRQRHHEVQRLLPPATAQVVAHVAGTLRSATGGPAKHRRGAASTSGASREVSLFTMRLTSKPWLCQPGPGSNRRAPVVVPAQRDTDTDQ